MESHEQQKRPIAAQNTVYKCDFCVRIFADKADFVSHSASEHPHQPPDTDSFVFKCNYKKCERVFPREDLFKSHHKVVHGEKENLGTILKHQWSVLLLHFIPNKRFDIGTDT